MLLTGLARQTRSGGIESLGHRGVEPFELIQVTAEDAKARDQHTYVMYQHAHTVGSYW